MEFLTNHEIIRQARRNARGPVWDYLTGGSESETAMRRNRFGLDSIAFKPRVLNDVSEVDYATTVLGHKSRIPVFLAPMASLQLVTPAAAQAVDDAAEEFGILNMLSGHSMPTLEEIAMNSLHPKVYQIYVRGGRDWLEELLGRVKQNNYAALAVTVDAAVYSNRERQMMAGWTPPTRKNAAGREFLAALNWDTWDEIGQIWGGPMILKGVSRPEDAEIGVQHGASVIYVSNHGGRQLDHDRATIQVLPEIVAAVDGKAEIFVDGGFMRGTDVLKAIALGAQAVGIGKLQAFALAAGGLSALMDCLSILEDEIKIAMGLLGVTSLDQLNPSFLATARPVNQAHEMSAFPHIPGGRLT
ncbi:MAG: alpha-hydroxy-acid oxidizing enzyme [Rhodospirillaceae bacterium]|nr:alpha-hydroxy-acid oxidizing enzyme [Rhodospirillaceae bacterium]|tara:strand:- start:5174 stop:6244 length:1071 start_codon:yes stop_codon:yes gene_type:complete